MAENKDQDRISIFSLFELGKNSFRLLRVMWQEHGRLVLWRFAIVVAVAIMPFLQLTMLGLLLNRLVEVAGKAAGVHSLQDFMTQKPLGDHWDLINLALVVLAVVAVRMFMPFFVVYKSYLQWLSSESLTDRLDLKVLERRGKVDVAGHEDRARKALFGRVRDQGVSRVVRFEERQFQILQNMIEVVAAMLVVGITNWIVLVAITLGALPGLMAEIQYGRSVWKLQAAQLDQRRKSNNLRSHFEQLPWLSELKLFQNVGRFLDMIGGIFLKLRREEEENERLFLRKRTRLLVVSQLVIACAIIWFIWEVIAGVLPIGQLVLVIAAIEAFRLALSNFFTNVGLQSQDSHFVSDTFQLLELQPQISLSKDGYKVPSDKAPEIVFENVSFSYPDSKKLVLKDFSLRIAPGEKIAFVGTSGAGKTTLVKLLCRFYDPTAGRILVNGRDLKELDLQSLYSVMGVMSQSYACYALPVREGISLGRSDDPFSLVRVKSAAAESEADEFIEELPSGYDTVLRPENSANNGIQLARGEWQKLALARTFYRQAKVLVLDEPTSSVDADAEARIFETLRNADGDHTEILISHRFSTVRNVDRIVVLEDGAIRELGTHDELMRAQGPYAKLFELQAKGYGNQE